jgi:hypothetical protein
MYRNGRNILNEKRRSASLSITNRTWNERGSKPSLQDETPGLIGWATARILETRISLPYHWEEERVVDRWGQETQTNYDNHISGQEDYRSKHLIVTDETQPKVNLTFIGPRIVIYFCSKPTRCAIFAFIEYHSTCFGRPFFSSSGVQDCTYSIKYMSYRYCWLLASGHEMKLSSISWW